MLKFWLFENLISVKFGCNPCSCFREVKIFADFLLFIVTYDIILLLLAIYVGRLYQQDGHNVIDIIFL